jgi:protein SCO1/2
MMYGVSALLMGAGLLVMYTQEQRSKRNKKTKVWHTGKADIGGEWALIDTKGRPFGSDQLRGHYYMVYFGFCNCPDICPNTLTKLSKAYQQANSALPTARLKLVFISVDPDRDTPQKIDKWLAYFNSEFIGLTAVSNADPALKDTMQKFKIYASKIEYDDVEEQKRLYTIDHTILTYLMDDNS